MHADQNNNNNNHNNKKLNEKHGLFRTIALTRFKKLPTNYLLAKQS